MHVLFMAGGVANLRESQFSSLKSAEGVVWFARHKHSKQSSTEKQKFCCAQVLCGVTELTEAVRAPALPLQWLSEAERTALHQRRTELPSQLKKAAA